MIKDADSVGQVGNPICGDMMTFYIKVKDNRLVDIKFQTFGCGAAIAVSSMISEMAMGKTLEEAKKISNKSVADELGGLPKNKLHCSNLGADALHKAIENYEQRQAEEKKVEKAVAAPEKKEEECYCPFCEGPLEGLESYCGRCNLKLEECPQCGKLTRTDKDECVHCGAARSKV